MFHDEKHVVTGNAVIVWDGVTRPGTDEKTKEITHSLKVALPAADPTVAELNKLATDCLNGGQFKGSLPPGGNWPFLTVAPTDFDGMLPAHISINSKTRRGAPQVYDVNGRELNAMEYSSLLYPGAIVNVLIHAYDFNNVQKGVAFGLDGIMIIDATAPKLPVGGINAAEAFGAGRPGAAPGVAPPTMAPPGMPVAAPPGVAPPGVAPMVAPPGAAPPAAAPAMIPVQHPAPAAAPDFLQPGSGVVRNMTVKAGGATYDSFIAQGWTDALLIQHGYMLAADGIPF